MELIKNTICIEIKDFSMSNVLPCKRFLPKARVFSGASAFHSFIVKRDGSLNAIGRNEFGQLGLGDLEGRSSATEVEFFGDISTSNMIKMAACGTFHSLFLTESGELFSSGLNEDGQLGLSHWNNCSVPERVRTPRHEVIEDIVCGAHSSHYLTGSGILYSFGDNEYGQLGNYRGESGTNHVIAMIPNEEKVIRVSAGVYHVAVLTEKGKVFTFGLNSQHQLGRVDGTRIPAEIQDLPSSKPVLQVLCGGFHTTVVLSSTEIYSFGNNMAGLLGIGRITYQQVKPVKIEWFEKNPVQNIQTGGSHTFAILETGDIVAYGFNAYFQLGQCGSSMIWKPKDMNGCDLKNSYIVDIVCGCNHTLLITRDGRCYGVGHGEAFGRGSDHHLISPKLFLEQVDLGKSFDISYDLSSYIHEEQYVDLEERRSTDFAIRNGENAVIHLNRAFLELRCPQLLNIRELKMPESSVYTFLSCLYGINDDERDSKERKTALFEINPKSILDCMKAIYDKKEDEGDMQIVSQNGDTHMVHKFVLIARTQYFKSLFRGGWRESSKNSIHLEMILGEPFDIYLKWLYTEECDEVDVDCIHRILEFIDYFGGGVATASSKQLVKRFERRIEELEVA